MKFDGSKLVNQFTNLVTEKVSKSNPIRMKLNSEIRTKIKKRTDTKEFRNLFRTQLFFYIGSDYRRFGFKNYTDRYAKAKKLAQRDNKSTFPGYHWRMAYVYRGKLAALLLNDENIKTLVSWSWVPLKPEIFLNPGKPVSFKLKLFTRAEMRQYISGVGTAKRPVVTNTDKQLYNKLIKNSETLRPILHKAYRRVFSNFNWLGKASQ